MKNKTTWREYFKILLSLGLPVALQNLLATTASMVDTIMIGTQGQLAVAAVGISSQVSMLFFGCYWGFASGSVLFFSQFWGARDEKSINKTLGISLLFTGLVGIIFALGCCLIPEKILAVYTDKENIIALGIPYLRIYGFSTVLIVVNTQLSMMLRSTERVRLPLICSIVALVVNFAVNYVLINGHFGAPKMGAAGAAVGTVVSTAVNTVLLVIFVLRDQKKVHLHLRDMFGFDKKFTRLFLSKCFPILCNELLYAVGQAIINVVVGHQAEAAIAAMVAFRVCEGFVYAFFGGLSSANSVTVGKEVGAGHLQTAFQHTKRSSLICPLITFTIVLICVILNRPLFLLFGLEEQAITYGKYMLMIYLLFGSIRTCNYIMNDSYRSGGEAVFGTVLEITCLFTISVPATWVSGMILHLPFLAVFALVYTDEILRLIVELRYTFSGRWIKPVTELGQKALTLEENAFLLKGRKKK